ncbi:hypothetical protein M514_27680, partial [Trichuris suis]
MECVIKILSPERWAADGEDKNKRFSTFRIVQEIATFSRVKSKYQLIRMESRGLRNNQSLYRCSFHVQA